MFGCNKSGGSGFASAIGKGILAGIAGTVAITVSQMIEMKITGRKPSDAPVKAAGKVLDIEPIGEQNKKKVSQEIHWVYGTSWGIARGIIGLTGLKGIPAALVHFAAIWGTSMIMLPALEVAPPVTEEKPEEIGIDGLHHAVYAAAVGVVYDALK